MWLWDPTIQICRLRPVSVGLGRSNWALPGPHRALLPQGNSYVPSKRTQRGSASRPELHSRTRCPPQNEACSAHLEPKVGEVCEKMQVSNKRTRKTKGEGSKQRRAGTTAKGFTMSLWAAKAKSEQAASQDDDGEEMKKLPWKKKQEKEAQSEDTCQCGLRSRMQTSPPGAWARDPTPISGGPLATVFNAPLAFI